MADDLRVGASEDEPWALRLETLTSWRAHPRALRAIAVSADEASVLTVGGAGAGADASPGAVRVWSAGGCSPGSGPGSGGAIASHEAHAHAPTCAAFVPRGGVGCGAALVASADAGGALHVWRADTGETVAKLREPAASLARMRTGFGFGHGQATHGNAARRGQGTDHDNRAHTANVAANVHANTNTPTGASTFSRRLSDASPTGIVSGSPGSPATSPPPPFSSTSDLISSHFPSPSLGSATLDAEYYAASPRSPPTSRAYDPSSPSAAAAAAFFSDDFASPAHATRSASLSSPAASATVGYACAAFAPAPANEGTLAMGTSDGRVRFADVRAGRLLGAWGVGPAAGEAAGTVRAICFPGDGDGDGDWGGDGPGDGRGRGRGHGHGDGSVGWTCAGTSHGFVGLLDRRAGRLVSGFSAHDGAVTAAAAAADGWRFVTAGADKTVACWDARVLASSTGGGHKNALTASFGGFKDPVAGLALRGEDAFAVAGGRLGVFSLAGAPAGTIPGTISGTIPGSFDASASASGKTPAWIAAKHVPVAPLRIRTVAGAKEMAQMSAVAVLPQSRLFVVATEDGVVKMCR